MKDKLEEQIHQIISKCIDDLIDLELSLDEITQNIYDYILENYQDDEENEEYEYE